MKSYVDKIIHSKKQGYNDKWITSRTGIRERHILKDTNQGTSILGIAAVQGLLQKTNTDTYETLTARSISHLMNLYNS